MMSLRGALYGESVDRVALGERGRYPGAKKTSDIAGAMGKLLARTFSSANNPLKIEILIRSVTVIQFSRYT